MSKCFICENEAGIDKRGRIRKLCSMLCVAKHSANIRRMKSKCCLYCKKIYTPKYQSKQKFCSRKCKAKHYYEDGTSIPALLTGQNNLIPFINKGKTEKSGYNPYKRVHIKGKCYYEHRLIMQNHIGRPLTRDEKVHHINGDHKDNRIENLKIVTVSEHSYIHSLEKICHLHVV